MESIYQELFNLMYREHGVILLETELQEIIQVALKIEKTTESGEGQVQRGVIRIFFLRLLVGSWMIPATWSLLWCLGALLFGVKEANKTCVRLTEAFWKGSV